MSDGTVSLNLLKLLDELKNNPLVVFIGSGINGTLVPQWDKLLGKLLDNTIEDILFSERIDEKKHIDIKNNLLKKLETVDYYARASLVKTILDERYKLQLKWLLYEKFSINELMEEIKNHIENKDGKLVKVGNSNNYEYLIQTAFLCSQPQVQAVVTYNFDNLLEILIKEIALRPVYSISGNKSTGTYKANSLPVYHVHGLIPYQSNIKIGKEENIVLSREEYFQNMLEPFSWQTTTQLHFLTTYTCLFLGASLDDWNMLRMLSFAKKNVSSGPSKYVLRTNITIGLGEDENKTITDNTDVEDVLLNRMYSTIWDEVGIRAVFVGKNKHDYSALWGATNIISQTLYKQKLEEETIKKREIISGLQSKI